MSEANLNHKKSLAQHYNRELVVMSQLNNGDVLTQRDIAQRTGYSVGLINMILKKLISTGYVKTVSLNRRRLKYLLTKEGFLAISKKSYRYILETIQHYQLLKKQVIQIINELYCEGYREFSIHGDGELRQLIQETIANDLASLSIALHDHHKVEQARAVL